MEKVVFTNESKTLEQAEQKINSYLDQGWKVKMVFSENVSASSSYSARGGYLVVLEKEGNEEFESPI